MKPFVFLVACIFVVHTLFAQSDNESLGNKFYHFLDRLDIKLKNDSLLGFTTVKPYSKKNIAARIRRSEGACSSNTSGIRST